MGKTYNIVFNSPLGTPANTVGEDYFIDWSRLPQGKYKGTFTFVSTNITTIGDVPNVFMNLGCSNNFYASNPSNNSIIYNYNLIGSLIMTGIGSNHRLSADLSTNAPFYLNSRPVSNNVTIYILRNNATQDPYLTALSVVPNIIYTLILNLELLD